jgi:hypothetical protein
MEHFEIPGIMRAIMIQFLWHLTPELSCVAHLRARPQHKSLYLTNPFLPIYVRH